jgi:intraflagellar transport protein 80
MKVQVLPRAEVSSLTGIDGMVVAAGSDRKHFYTAIDGACIRKYPINVDDLTQTTDDVFMLKQLPVMCIGLTRDTGAPNSFVIGCADGNPRLHSPNGRVEKSMEMHTGGATCVSVNPDGLWTLSGGDDGVVKIRNRTGILRTNLAGAGGAATSCN